MYLPMARGFVYPVAIMDWHSSEVLSWRLSNTMDSSFCVDALNEAIESHGTPEIFNTDQGSQFTSDGLTAILKAHEIAISMDGRGRWLDNVFIERLWRSVKYEEVYLKGYEGMLDARHSLDRYFEFYNRRRRHQLLENRTSDQVYYQLGQAAGERSGEPVCCGMLTGTPAVALAGIMRACYLDLYIAAGYLKAA